MKSQCGINPSCWNTCKQCDETIDTCDFRAYIEDGCVRANIMRVMCSECSFFNGYGVYCYGGMLPEKYPVICSCFEEN